MKKNILLISILSIFLFSSCKKDSTLLKEQTFLTKQEIALIGTEHNRLLIEIFDLFKNGVMKVSSDQIKAQTNKKTFSIDTSESNLLNIVNSVYVANGYSALTATELSPYLLDYSITNVDVTISNTVNNVSNPVQLSILNAMLNTINNTSNYNTLFNNLSALRIQAENELTGLDQSATLVAIEVAINSAQMWYPVANGGLGYFTGLSNTLEASSITSNMSQSETILQANIVGIKNKVFVAQGGDPGHTVGLIVGADAIGAFGGFCRAALPYFLSGGPVNPISNGILFGSALIGGATASASTAFAIAAKK